MRRDVVEADRTVMVTHRDVRALGDMMLDLPAWRGSAASSAARADPNVETSGLAPESLESGRRQTAQRTVELTRRGADAEALHPDGEVDVRVEVQLLGRFTVLVHGAPTPAGAWSRRHAATLVKLLAISPGGRLHRDRVVDTLWPDLTLDVALPRLHKAAHYARRDLGDRDAVVLRGEVVALFPNAALEVDAVTFEAAADAALAARPVSPDECRQALKLAGDLLPEDLGEPWLEEPRERLRLRVAQLLRGAHRWEDLVRVDPMDEQAHVELLREAVVAGDRTTALRRYVQMERVLQQELGISPGPEAIALRERVLVADAEARRWTETHVMVGIYGTDPDTGRRRDRLAWLRAEDVHRVLRADDAKRR
ncbi:MAG TPA: BTAD domain-containing putative transcriptional regulator [Candidatus Binatia bacterium]|nr:BTAD domain-containing putative transcriptional regulator [Candidatus Binatia bacterium]